MSDEKLTRRGPDHTEAGPDIAPHGRDEMLEEHRGRREDEPAAASMETDAESGGASTIADLPDGETPKDPAKRYLNQGNASRQDSAYESTGGSTWIIWVIAALIALAIIYAVTQL